MENLDTPIGDKEQQPLDANESNYNSDIDDNEQNTLKNNISGSDLSFYNKISPTDHNINIPETVMSDHEIDEPETTVCNDSLQDDQTLCYFNNSSCCDELDSDSVSDSSTEADDTFFHQLNAKNINDIIMEISQAVHNYSNKIKDLDISVEWELPETLIAKKGLRKSESGLKGQLSPEEVSYIKKRLREFSEEYNINYGAIRACLAERVSKLHFPNELRLKFIQYLCKDFVNDRNLLTLFRAISKLGLRKGKYDIDEENFLIDMYHNYKGANLHAVCGLMLNRHREKIIRKIERLKKRDSLGPRPSSCTIKTKPLKLRKLILKNILIRRNYDLAFLKHRINKHSWLAIGREYNVSPAIAKAIYFCDFFPQIYAVHPVKFNGFFIRMFCKIKRSDWQTWEEVKWTRLSTLLYDVGPLFVYVILRKIIMHYVPKEKWNDFRGCAEYLYENIMPYFENGPKKVTLNRILIQQNER